MSKWGWKEKLEHFWKSPFQGLNSAVEEDLAVDLGTANTRIYRPGAGLALEDQTMIALDFDTGHVVAVGHEAKSLAGRGTYPISVVRPVRDGAVADCEAAGKMLAHFIGRVLPSASGSGPGLLLCVPSDITPLEQRAYEDVARRAGARRATLVESPYAAAAGAGIDLRQASACMIVDLGAGTTDIAVISGGSVLQASTRRIGGREIDGAIVRYLHAERMTEVSEEMAEQIKIGLGAVDDRRESQVMAVRGRNLKTLLPEEITVTGEEIRPLILPTLRLIQQHVRTTLEEIPTEASVDLLDTGITLSGGLAQLPGLAEHLSQELGLCVQVSAGPLQAAALGAGQLLEQEAHISASHPTGMPATPGAVGDGVALTH